MPRCCCCIMAIFAVERDAVGSQTIGYACSYCPFKEGCISLAIRVSTRPDSIDVFKTAEDRTLEGPSPVLPLRDGFSTGSLLREAQMSVEPGLSVRVLYKLVMLDREREQALLCSHVRGTWTLTKG